jgi:hypothetical protein
LDNILKIKTDTIDSSIQNIDNSFISMDKGERASQIILGGSSTGVNEASNCDDENVILKNKESLNVFESKNSMIDQSHQYENAKNKKINTYKSVIIEDTDALAIIRNN